MRRILDSENEEAEFVIVGVNGEGNDGVWTIIAIEEMEAVVEEKGIRSCYFEIRWCFS